MLLDCLWQNINPLPNKHKGHTGKYWPKVVGIWTKHSKVWTKNAEGQYSRLLLKQASLVHLLSSLLKKKLQSVTAYDHFRGNSLHDQKRTNQNATSIYLKTTWYKACYIIIVGKKNTLPTGRNAKSGLNQGHPDGSYFLTLLKFHGFPWPFPWPFQIFHDQS